MIIIYYTQGLGNFDFLPINHMLRCQFHFCCCHKNTLIESYSGKKGFILVHNYRWQSIIVGKLRGLKLKADSHIISSEKQKEMKSFILTLSCFHLLLYRIQTQEMVLPTEGQVFPCQSTLLRQSATDMTTGQRILIKIVPYQTFFPGEYKLCQVDN